jgi:hypothetical protein
LYFSDTWKFTVQDEIVVDHFDYPTSRELNEFWFGGPEIIAQVVGDLRTVDENSMKLSYDNTGELTSTVVHLPPAPMNWLDGGGQYFNIWLQSSDIRPEDMVYIQIYDQSEMSAVIAVAAPEILNAGEDGQKFSFPFDMLPGMDLTQITQLNISVGNMTEPCLSGNCQGTILVDDMGVTGTACVELEADLDGNGFVDIDDFSIMASQWLEAGC